jgi:stage V sporulation protein R
MNLGFYNTNLPPHLRVLKDEIEAYARGFGLDFFETIFEVVDADDLNEIAAYGGFPTRYPHWSFGMQYEELKKGYEYGLSKIYEMVINNDPCYAYLMRCNHTVDQKLVMAHVYGHCDFFKNNAYFGHTTRKMMDEIANHAARIRHHVERFGEDEVEAFMDKCMSIDDLIDIHSVAIKRRDDHSKYDFTPPPADGDSEEGQTRRFKAKGYMADYINPRAALKAEDEERKKLQDQRVSQFPERPEKDVLLFLIEHAPLKSWQRDILSIVRDEAYYFYPQGQTKILNEGWACTVSHSLVCTDRGFLRMGDIVGDRATVRVSDGTQSQPVYDWAKFEERDTVRIRTRRKLELEGSLTHRVLLSGGTWKPLGEIAVGDRLQLARGTNLWATEPVKLEWELKRRRTMAEVADAAGVSPSLMYEVRRGRAVTHQERILPLLAEYDQEQQELPKVFAHRAEVHIPEVVDERFGAFLGYLIGDGHISDVKRTIGMTSGDEPQADAFVDLVHSLFGLEPVKKWDKTKWRVRFSSRTVQDFLVSLGLKTGFAARVKDVPDCVLRSPKPVVAAFLRALYDCDGYAGPAGVILSTSSEEMSKTVQLLLLNFGILSTRRPHKDECWHVQTLGQSAKVFAEQISFGLERKQARLAEYIENRKWFKEEREDDEIVSVERGRAEVFDISVEETHRYVAQGLINHNSFWHSTMMTQKVLQPSEVIDYADHHSGTMATSSRRLNPYKLGIELLRDIERRWNMGQFGPEWENCDDMEKKRNWDTQAGLGRQKIFEVRKIHNDITFIDTFLTPEFCKEYKLFSFNYNEHGGNYVIESREFQKVKQRLLFSLTNFGKPWIYVVDGNYRNRGELLLRHDHNGVDLKVDEARDTLANVQYLWGRPVHLETIFDGHPTVMGFDGTEHTQQVTGGTDDANRKPAPKAK